MSSIIWLIHANNDTWCRDFGPITVSSNGQPLALDFQFNGWGQKFEYHADNEIPRQLVQQQILKCDLKTIPVVLEGGSIDSDGEGTLLTTEQCLLSVKRNPDLDKKQITKLLKEELGCERVFWLKHGHLEGDDTDSHIDNLARFCSNKSIAYASCDDPTDSHYESLKQMENELKQLTTSAGSPYDLIPLNIPAAQFDDGDRVPASYVNFLITNKLILMPAYNDPEDEINRQKLQSVFKERKVITIPCSSIIKQSGSVHCLTMQLPARTITQ